MKSFSSCLLLTITLLIGMVGSTRSTVAATTRPNIILIMVDDMGWSDIGCYGSEINTPNIDRLASEGILFTQFYNNAKCTTTRSSLLTGLYPRNGGRGQDALITQQMLTLGEAMRHAGYATGLSGKWHNGSTVGTRPYDRGFDESYGLWGGCCNFFNPKIPDPKFKGGAIRTFGHNEQFLQLEDFPDDYYTTDAFTTHAIETIKANAAAGETFFHYLPYTAPHYPLHAKPEDIAKYKGRYKQGWEVLRQERLAKQTKLGLIDERWEVIDRDDRSKSWQEAKQIDQGWQELRMEVYAAMIDSVDQNIGRLLDTLDLLGIAKNTLVIFISDNGGCAETPGGTDPNQTPGPKEFYSHVGPGWATASNTPFRRYKQYCHEGGISSPFVARWPETIQAGTRTDQVGHVIDLLPTFLEMAGTHYPNRHPEFNLPTIPVDGKTLLPILKGERRKEHDSLFWHWASNRAIRSGQWKLSWDRYVKKWELYDMSTDRVEAHNLADDHPDLVTMLSKKWFQWAEMTDINVK